MNQQIRQRLTRGDIWMRALYMVLFAIAYSIAELLITVVVIVQFIIILLSGTANEALLRLGRNLSQYVYQILCFVTFNSETMPFPFASWPDEEPGGHRWLEPAQAVEPAPVVEPEPKEQRGDEA